jgi:hypothetical protein
MRTKLAFAATIALMCAAVPAVAHHSITGEYDANKTVSLSGTVTKIEWTNPHARMYIDVKQPDGSVVNWNLELLAVSALVRNGWTRNAVKIGDSVSIEGIQARSGASIANARVVTLPNGNKVFSGNNDQ